MAKSNHGLIIVYTGKGKGKTTAALGLMLRAWGHGFRICVIQFIKNEKGRWGEVKAAQKLGIEWHKTGDGFTWKSNDQDETAAKAKRGWLLAQEKITSNHYDLIILDELTYALHNKWIDVEQVTTWLKSNKPSALHLVITGRYAPKKLLDIAEIATNMKKIKHIFDQGESGQKGIEF